MSFTAEETDVFDQFVAAAMAGVPSSDMCKGVNSPQGMADYIGQVAMICFSKRKEWLGRSETMAILAQNANQSGPDPQQQAAMMANMLLQFGGMAKQQQQQQSNARITPQRGNGNSNANITVTPILGCVICGEVGPCLHKESSASP